MKINPSITTGSRSRKQLVTIKVKNVFKKKVDSIAHRVYLRIFMGSCRHMAFPFCLETVAGHGGWSGRNTFLLCIFYSSVLLFFKCIYCFYSKNFSTVQILAYCGVDRFLIGVSTSRVENAAMCASALERLVSSDHRLPQFCLLSWLLLDRCSHRKCPGHYKVSAYARRSSSHYVRVMF